MTYTTFTTTKDEYKLALTTSAICQLEKKIGCNPLSVFGDGSTIPTVSTMVLILHASLQKYQHGISEEKACAIFDEWLDNGNVITDFVPVILDIYKVSGLIKAEEETEKN